MARKLKVVESTQVMVDGVMVDAVEYEAGLWVEFDKWFAVSLELRRAAGAPTVNCSI